MRTATRVATALLTAALALCAVIASAQSLHYGEYFELHSTLNANQSHEYYANNYIDLNPGFHSEPDSGYRTILELDSEGYAIHPPEEGFTDNYGFVVGTVGGSVDINAMGGLVYSIPLELPTGINGLQPNLSINYDSQKGNGLMGWGWYLGGLSSITRTGKTLYHDGEMSAVEMSWQDRFLLDGKRLVQIADYTDSIEFRTEQDEMSKIMAYYRTEHIIGIIPIHVLDHFVIWKADGLIMEYGATEDSWIDAQSSFFHALCWQLSKVTDRNGNSIKYHYQENQSQGYFYIDTIEYTANESQEVQAQFAISFNYNSSRQDSEMHFIAGNQLQIKHLLTGVTIVSKADGKTLQKYEFNYTWNPDYLYNLLSRVYLTAYNADGIMERVRGTSVNWDLSSPKALDSYTPANPEIFNDFPFTGDFNGDGYTDVALVPYKDSTVYNNPVTISIYLNDRNCGFEHIASMDLTVPASLDWIHVLDIDGDGLDDLVPYFYDTIPSTATESTSVTVYRNNPSTQSFVLVGNRSIPSKGDVLVGDFNGDLNQDVILLEKDYDEVTINSGLQWYDTVPFIENVFFIGYHDSLLLNYNLNTTSLKSLGPFFNTISADFTGDGICEVLLVGINHNNTPYHGSKICGFDFSGNNNGCVVLQDFSTFFGSSYYPYHRIGTMNPWCPVFSGDYNGDGMTDIIYYHYSQWYVCFSEGESMGMPLEIWGAGVLPAIDCNVNLYYPSLRLVQNLSQTFSSTCVVADFDGDGCSDVGVTQEGSGTMYFLSRISKNGYSNARFRRLFHANGSLNFHSQFIHVGNYLGRDNMSFLCSSDVTRSIEAKILSLRPVSLFNSVASITDGLGNRTFFTYDYLTPKPVGTTDPFYSYNYTAPNTFGVGPFSPPVMALKTCSVERVNDCKAITKYRYSNAMNHKYGHGFLGFSSSTVETYHNSTDSLWTTKKTCYNESSTMGRYAFLLPQREFSFVNDNGYSIAVNKTRYTFTNVNLASDLTNLVVCPALTRKVEEIYSMDEDDEMLATDTTYYQYNYHNGYTYDSPYGCTNTTQVVTGFENGHHTSELRISTQTELQTIGTSWIVNRPNSETTTRTRNNESTASRTVYTYWTNGSYKSRTVTVIPNDGSQPNDPLTLSTFYEYDPFGNVSRTTVSAPFGIHGEQTRIAGYEYGEEYQHRLLTAEMKGPANNCYVSHYEYGFNDRPIQSTDCNGKKTGYASSVLGTDKSVFPPDGTEQRSLTLWADQSPYKPTGASYYTWEKKTGGATTMTFYHKSGIELRSVTFDYQGHPVFIDKKYNSLGMLESESAPYKWDEPEESIRWTRFHYDTHDRISRIDNPDGSTRAIVYDGLETATTTSPPQGSPASASQTTVTRTNILGWLRESVDADGTSVHYEYYSDGNLKWTRIGSDESTKTSMEYDHAGNRTRLHDPDYCTGQRDLLSVYNAFGEEVSRATPKDHVTSFTYDRFGRMTGRHEEYETEPGIVDITDTYWNYSETAPQKGLLLSVTHPGQTISHAYDTCQRVVSDTVRFPGGETHITQYAYDQASRLASVTHPSGVTVTHQYNSNGFPSVQFYGNNAELYRTRSTTPMGQTEHFVLGGLLQNTLEYDPEKHLPTRIKTQKNTATIQNLSFTYDGFCNLASRKDNMRNLEETFEYDSQNRLTGIRLGAMPTGASEYDTYGRMTAKSSDGQSVFSNMEYESEKPHAMASATTLPGVFPSTAQTVAYTGFDKVSKIKQGGDSLCYTYGYDRQRILMEEHIGNMTRTKRYVGNCEYVTETEGNTVSGHWLTYLTGPTGVYAVVLTKSGADQVFYILKDNLGSWTTITDESGHVKQRLSYDAWGNPRDPNTWSGSFTGTPLFDRGFTGHEHLYDFGLINMNGRMYDPVMSSFLSVDQYVQTPENAQGLNRYAYCSNNPLKYVDPSGWLKVGGQWGFSPNHSANDPYAYVENRPLEPRDLGLRQLPQSDLDVVWMEGSDLRGGGGGGGIVGGGFYVNLASGLIEHHDGQTNYDYLKQGLVFLANDNASINDIETALEQKGMTYEKDPRVAGGYIVDTEELFKGYLLWQSIPSMTVVFAIGSLECFFNSISTFPIINKTSEASTKVSYEFTNTALKHMNEPSRRVPLNIIDEVIKNPQVVTLDPEGTNALKYFSTIYKNGKPYNIEVLYDKSNNTIYHFLFSPKTLGPLPPIKP